MNPKNLLQEIQDRLQANSHELAKLHLVLEQLKERIRALQSNQAQSRGLNENPKD